QFSIEPFLLAGGRLITWNDVPTVASTAGNGLPIPIVTWKTSDIAMAITGFAAGRPDSSVLYARYRVSNPTATPKNATLYLAVRPFQVNPPWQFLNTLGGVAPIDSISYAQGNVRVNGNRLVIPLTVPTGFGAMSLGEGSLIDLLRHSRLPSSTQASDPLGFASGALSFALTLRPHADTTIDIAIPLHDSMPTCANGSIDPCEHGWTLAQFKATTSYWNEKLGRVAINVPADAAIYPTSIRANLAYILINRDGPAIQPGSRSYERSWIRDGALTSAALLRLGQFDEVKEFIDWYARHQFANGKIPCCVDARGADPVPENDSQGEFIYLVAEYYRHTGDRALLERTWPNVSRAFAFMDSLRQSRTTAEYQTGDKRVFYGLMPQSISHEGYSAKPMHSYWDDFFALRGFKDAAEIAALLGKPEVTNYVKVSDTFRRDFYASIRLSMSQHNIDYIPGAADLGDFDATSTTIALNPADELSSIPQPALDRTFEKYYENFVIRRDGKQNWEAYTPYEWRVVGTMVRLGEKAKAHEIADFFFRDQRPNGWHQWGEVVYRDSLNPKFIGDMPHTWVGSDFIRSTLDMFAFEREVDSSLVVGAGIPEAWVREDSGVSIKGLSTHYGLLSYRMTAHETQLRVALDAGTRIPPGGIVVESPSSRAVRRVTVNGSPATAGKSGSVTVRSLPAVISFSY
ncbi:MAG: coagulation factor 5/8 type domain-containing protein, partial [Gemmatimonadaceae bacterium]